MAILKTLTINGTTYKVATQSIISSVTLPASEWIGEEHRYYQLVDVANATEIHQVDLTPSDEQLVIFREKDLAFLTVNRRGAVTVYAIGQKPTNDYTMQVTLTEVAECDEIIGVTVGTPISPDKIAEKLQIAEMQAAIAAIQAELRYEPIDITSFSCPGAGTYEIGTSVPAPTITWGLNKEPVSQTMNGASLGADERSKVYTGNITGTTSYKLTVTDEKGNTDSATGSFNFYNGVYYGSVADGATIDSAAILNLSKKVQGGRGVTFTVSPTSKERIAYAIPATGYGTPVFKDANSGFQVDMYRLDDPVEFTNTHGYTTPYYVWLSTYPQEKETTVVVS